MTLFLFDNQEKNSYVTFKNKLQNIASLRIYTSPKCVNSKNGWFKGCIIALKQSKKNDTIICWFDFQAILCFWICKFLFLKRRIIALNILLKDKDSIKNKIVSQLYRRALLSKNFKASVTSEAYGEWLNKKLGINVEYTLIHDVYHDSYECTNYVYTENVQKSVFCGGRNGRDWDFMIEVAKSLPNVNFNLIMPKDVFLKYKQSFTPNIYAQYDVSYNEFMKTLCESPIVCLPLDTEAPAGLIVMFQAAANKKLVLTTKTVTTVEYINEERGELLGNDLDDWSKTIEFYLDNSAECSSKADNLYSFLKQECAEANFVNGIKRILL